jgi:tetratricopeptide (TPR) repeat protein
LGALTLGGCASGGAGGGGGPRPSTTSSSALAGLPEGEPIANNAQTREAERQLNLALIQQGETQTAAYQAALTSAQQAITTDARNPLPWLQKGKAHIGLKQWAAADSALKQAEALRPVYLLEVREAREKAWYDIYNEGGTFLRDNRYEESLPVFEAANIIYDRRPEIMVILGQIHYQLGNYEKAIENAQRGLTIIKSDMINEMDSVTAGIWREQEAEIPPLLAQSYLNLQRFSEAAATLRPLLDANPANQDYARTQASIFARMEQPDSATAVLQRMQQALGGTMSSSDHYVMAMTFYEMSDYPGAIGSFNNVLNQSPNNRDAVEWKTRALYELVQDLQPAGGQPLTDARNQLIQSAEAWLELDPNNNYPYLLLAGQLQASGNNDRAQQVVQQFTALPFYTGNLELRPGRGSVTVLADVTNKTMTAGQQLTLRFTFFGPNGATLGTKDGTVTLPVADATAALQVDFESAQPVEGYSYAVVSR